MAAIFKCLSLSLMFFIAYTNAYKRRVFKDFKLKQKEYSILHANSSGQGHDYNVICQSAKCEYKSETIYNVTNPSCGNYYTCQECPPSFGTDICYLGITSDEWMNITEGHLGLTKSDRVFRKGQKEAGDEKKANYEDEYDEDEDGFIELDSSYDPFDSGMGASFVQKFVSTQTFGYNDHHSEKWLSDNKKECQVDPDGTIELSIRLIFQYFKSPLNVHETPADANGGMSSLEISQSLDDQDEDGQTLQVEDDLGDDDTSDENHSFLQFKLFGKKKGDDSDDYYDEDDENVGENVFATVAKRGLDFSMSKSRSFSDKVKGGFKFLFDKAQVLMAKPEVHIHFVVDDIRIKSCRQPLSWSGEMDADAMIFVGNQNFRLSYDFLTVDFLKRAIRVNTSLKGVFDLSFNSCVQVHCTKRQAPRLQYVVSPLSNAPPPTFNLSRKFLGPGHYVPPNGRHTMIVTPLNQPNLQSPTTTAPITQHVPPAPAQPVVAPPAAAGPPAAPSQPTGPVTDIPSFNTPAPVAATPAEQVGGLVRAEGNKTRFMIFMGVGVLILILIIYFFFFRH